MSEYMPYLPPEEGWKKRFEITIPILLLILVFLVIAWKVGWLASIPVIGDFFKAKVTNVLVVGEDPSITMQLDTIKRDMALNYEVLKATDLDSVRDPAYIAKYNLVILTEYAYNSSEATPYLPAIFRGYLNSYMQGSGKLIVIGLAGSRDPASADTNAWAVMDYVPVACKTSKPCDPSDVNVRVANVPVTDRLTLKVRDVNNPVLKEFGTSLAFPSSVSSLNYYTIVNNKGGTELVTLEDTVGATTLAYPALVESSGTLGSKTIYFSFHPASHPALFRNVIKNM
jgi:hypothetical protein